MLLQRMAKQIKSLEQALTGCRTIQGLVVGLSNCAQRYSIIFSDCEDSQSSMVYWAAAFLKSFLDILFSVLVEEPLQLSLQSCCSITNGCNGNFLITYIILKLPQHGKQWTHGNSNYSDEPFPLYSAVICIMNHCSSMSS